MLGAATESPRIRSSSVGATTTAAEESLERKVENGRSLTSDKMIHKLALTYEFNYCTVIGPSPKRHLPVL
jgi:hypothetical protein